MEVSFLQLACLVKTTEQLVALVNIILPYKPESLETFGKKTILLGMRFFPTIAKKAHMNPLIFALQFLREGLMVFRHGIPQFMVLIELTEGSTKKLEKKVTAVDILLKNIPHLIMKSPQEAEKYWIMRRESFNLLRQKVKNKKAAPFIDDVIVKP